MKTKKLVKVLGAVSFISIIVVGGLYYAGSSQADENTKTSKKVEQVVAKEDVKKEVFKKKEDKKKEDVSKVKVSENQGVENHEVPQAVVATPVEDSQSYEVVAEYVVEDNQNESIVEIAKQVSYQESVEQVVVKEDPIIELDPATEEPVVAMGYAQAYGIVARYTGLDLESLVIIGSESGESYLFEVRQKSPHDQYITNMVGMYKVNKVSGEVTQ